MKHLPLNIVPYQEKYHRVFIDLNMHWIETYFEVEPYDKKQLEHCQEMIIDLGGCVYIGLLDHKPIGTYALIKIDYKTCEFSKMAVDVNYQGNGFGKQLVKHGIDIAKEMGFKNIVLYTNHKLETAIYIYEKFGFKSIELEPNCPYARCTKKMELNISKE